MQRKQCPIYDRYRILQGKVFEVAYMMSAETGPLNLGVSGLLSVMSLEGTSSLLWKEDYIGSPRILRSFMQIYLHKSGFRPLA